MNDFLINENRSLHEQLAFKSHDLLSINLLNVLRWTGGLSNLFEYYTFL